MDFGLKVDPPVLFSEMGKRAVRNKDESIEKTAEQFESFLMFSMLKEFEKASLSTKKSYAEQTQMSLFYEKVGDVLAKKGIGIKDMIAKYAEGRVKVSGDKDENR
jgi:Rod binding domain-containing protein